MQLSEDAQGILQPRRHFCDLSKRENLLPSAMLGSNTRLHGGVGKTMCFPCRRTGDDVCSAPPQGWLMVGGCMDHHILHVIVLVCPQLSRHVLEKCLFLYFFYKKGAEVPGSSHCTSYTCVLPWGHWLHQLLWGECKFLSSASVWKGVSGISFSSTWSVYPHDFSYISLLTSWPFIYLKTSLRQQGRCCKPTVRLYSRRAAQQAAGSECASGTDKMWQQQGL